MYRPHSASDVSTTISTRPCAYNSAVGVGVTLSSPDGASDAERLSPRLTRYDQMSAAASEPTTISALPLPPNVADSISTTATLTPRCVSCSRLSTHASSTDG